MANIVRRPEEQSLASAWESWDPFRLVNQMFESPLGPLFERRRMLPPGVLSPAFDVKERDDAYVIEADLPGVKEDDIDVSLTENRLTISGKREAKEEKKEERLYTFERQYGSFSRSFTLPSEADVDHIDADLEKGVLKLTIPKKEASKPRHISLKEKVKKALKS